MTATAAEPLTAPPHKRDQRHAEARTRRAEVQALIRRRAEEDAEAIAPRAQRVNVALVSIPDGKGGTITGMLPASRLTAERTSMGNTRVQRTNPITALVDRQERIVAGNSDRQPMFTKEHEKAAARLIVAFDETQGGINVAPGDLLRVGGSAAGSGVSEAKHAAMLAQVEARVELEAAMTFVGGLGDVIGAVVLVGVDVQAWATARGWDRKATVGYLVAAMDRLCLFYAGGDTVGAVFTVENWSRK